MHRRLASKASLLDLGLYITMFPQLIAGPIVRYDSVADALKKRTTTGLQVRDGILFFVLGMAQKVLIANNVAKVADTVFSLQLNQVTTSTAWIGAVAYTFRFILILQDTPIWQSE